MPGRRSSFAFWIAVIMAVACVVIVILHHTLLPWNFEIAGVSLAGLTGGTAIFAVLVHEFLDSVRGTGTQPRVEGADGAEGKDKPVVKSR